MAERLGVRVTQGLVGGEIRRGIVRAYDAVNLEADIELVGALTALLEDVPTAKEIDSGDMTDGAKVLVVLFDGYNPSDAVVVSVYG